MTHVFKSRDFISSIELIFFSEVSAGTEEDSIHHSHSYSYILTKFESSFVRPTISKHY